MQILGIDPGTGRTGWGIVETSNFKYQISNNGEKKTTGLNYIAHGCVVTSQDDSMPSRLLELNKSVEEIIKKFNPEVMVIEHIFFGRNTKTAISVGQARGVIMMSAARFNLPVFEYTGLAVKYSLAGHGRTEKKEMQIVVRRILNKNKRKLSFNAKDKGFDDAADALAIAIHHALKTHQLT